MMHIQALHSNHDVDSSQPESDWPFRWGNAFSLRSHQPASTHTRNPLIASLSSRVLIAASVLSTLALFVSIYLAYAGLTGTKVAGCDGGVLNCEHVLNSEYSKVLGIPVGIPAVGLYVVVLAALAMTRSNQESRRMFALKTISLLSFSAAIAALWFIGLQVFSIGHLCPYCLVVHACGITLAALMVVTRTLGIASLTIPAAISFAGVAVMIATQVLQPDVDTFIIEEHMPATTTPDAGLDDVFAAPDLLEAPTSSLQQSPTWIAMNPMLALVGVLAVPEESVASSTTENSRRLVPVLGGRRSLDASQWPLWGDMNATYIVPEMFDYTCDHCRNTHNSLKQASAQLGNQLAVIALPVPLSRACNDAATNNSPERADACELARIAIAVWLVDRTKFTAFHDWMFETKRNSAEARLHAEQLVGPQRLRETLAKSTPSNYIAKNVMLYKEAGSGTVPKIFFPTTTIVGEVGSGATVANMVQEKIPQ